MRESGFIRDLRVAFGVWATCVMVFGGVAFIRSQLGSDPSRFGAHYAHLADSFLHGQLHHVGNQPLGLDDEAHFRGRWYVSFPPLPALLLVPSVAIFGPDADATWIWVILAGFAPAILFRFLRSLSVQGQGTQSMRHDLWLTALFAFGTVYFCAAVQGTVWFVGHVVVCLALALYLSSAWQARRPMWAGLWLSCAFLTRPTTLLAGIFFLVESQRVLFRDTPFASKREKILLWSKHLVPFALPILIAVSVTLAYNAARFADPLEFGHRFLQVRWQPRIQQWGLFSFHYLSKNLCVVLAALPWLTSAYPFVRIPTQGLALWFTSPPLMCVLWPARRNSPALGLYLATGVLFFIDLLYQNTGWEQFGYRFSLDYTVFLIALIAITVPVTKLLKVMVLWSIAIQTLGAISFNRLWLLYERSPHFFFPPE